MRRAKFTNNKHGSMFPLARYTKAFLSYVKKHPGQVLDIGAAYGVTSIPALEAGANVTAMDLSAEQLSALKEHTDQRVVNHLTLVVGHFPEDLILEKNKYDAILASHILHFLGPKEFKIAIKKMYQILKPKGKIFVQCFTPYHRFTEAFIPVYERNCLQGKPWPGLMQCSNDYALIPNKLPPMVNLMDPEILCREFSKAGFVIEQCKFTACPKSLGKPLFVLNGKEWVGLIAHKP